MLRARSGSLAVAHGLGLTLSAFVGLASVASATDWYVDQSYSNCSQSDGSAGKPYCTIGGALAAARSGDSIRVAKGTYNEQVSPTFGLTLIGTDGAAKTILDAKAPIVDVNGVNVTIDGFTLQNGGPAITAENGATLAIIDCVVTGNYLVNFDGAGLQAGQASNVTITGTTFKSNTAYRAIAGGIRVTGGTCTILDSTFDDNVGGAILANFGVKLTVESTTFKNHSSVAVRLQSPATVAAFTGCTFVNNDGGGAINASSLAALDLANCTFSNNVADSGGGAIWVDSVASVDIADSTFDSNTGNTGGALHIATTNATCEHCTFHANEATALSGSNSGSGGAVYATFSSTSSVAFSDCLFDSNSADFWTNSGSGAGALTLESGPATIVRCRFVGNVSNGSWNLAGGALFSGGTLTATDCEFTGNQAVRAYSLSAGPGAILVTGAISNPVTFERCTIAGNTTSSTDGGLRIPFGGTAYLSHTIVAGNTATGLFGVQDVDGSVTSQGWNDFGNTYGLKLIGGSNDLLDVDPLFADPSNGDFSLQPTSPCVDSGDPTATPSGPDVGGNPRLLDGDLDGVLVLDRGAREFNNVHLDVTGTPTPGGTLTLTTSGTSGLPLLIIAGAAPGELFVHPFGALFIDLTQPFLIVPFGTIPNAQNFTLDPSMPAPVSFWLQEAAFGVGAGNLSNVVEVDVK